MMLFLRQSTNANIKLGPFVDKTDGVTYETGMAAAMNTAVTGVRLAKNGAAFVGRSETTEPVYDAFGYYLVKLNATDTNTVGTLKVIFGDAAVCLPSEARFQILEEAIFDSLFASSAVGFDTIGSGAISTTINVTVSGAPEDGVEVWISTDASGDNVIAGTLSTDAMGNAIFMLDAGTYYVWKQKSGVNFSNPSTIVVA